MLKKKSFLRKINGNDEFSCFIHEIINKSLSNFAIISLLFKLILKNNNMIS